MNRTTDLEARMDDGTTPLILAARHNLPDYVRHLIKAGVKVNSADSQGLFGSIAWVMILSLKSL